MSGVRRLAPGGYMRVLSTIDGSPAARAGIEAGDVLWSIDGVSTYGESYETAFARLQGNEGSTVEVEVVPWRDLGTGGTEQTVSASGRQKVQLVRESVQKVPVSFSIFESKGTNSLAQTSGDAGVADESSPREPELVGYIRLANFEEHTAESVANAVATCKFFGVSSFIMDMRNNTDGSVVEGLEVAKLFLDGGMRIVNVVGREGKSATVGLKPGTSALAREPLIVLVNRGSANTAEVLAGALKFNQRAVLVGERTYGQGRIQHQFPMKDGSQLFVTVAKYATPDAHNIDQVGVAPDVACSDAPRMDVTSEGKQDPLSSEAATNSAAEYGACRCTPDQGRLLYRRRDQSNPASAGGDGGRTAAAEGCFRDGLGGERRQSAIVDVGGGHEDLLVFLIVYGQWSSKLHVIYKPLKRCLLHHRSWMEPADEHSLSCERLSRVHKHLCVCSLGGTPV
eukprot:scaffold916_cov516-Prasinococcus_capsulatus_cf.AAC.31